MVILFNYCIQKILRYEDFNDKLSNHPESGVDRNLGSLLYFTFILEYEIFKNINNNLGNLSKSSILKKKFTCI